MSIINSMGHRFNPLLRCERCKVSWAAHQAAPKPCPIPEKPKGTANG